MNAVKNPLVFFALLLIGGSLTIGVERAEAAAYDTYFSSVVLGMHMDGSSGSTAFGDVKGHAVTAVGSAQISTAQSKFGGASALFNGTTDYLTTPDSNDWNFGSGDFTIETWVRFNSLASNQAIVAQFTDAGTTVPSWQLVYITGVGMYFAYHNGASEQIVLNSGTTGWATNTWYHVAVVRNGTTWTMYRDGVSVAQVTGNSTTMPDIVGALWIGNRNYGGNSAPLNGYLDDLRITKGVARYTAAFTPPTTQFPDSGRVVAPTYAKYKFNGGKFNFKGGYFRLGTLGALDIYWNSVVLALHMDGANGSTAFPDRKGHLVTANGSAQVSTAQSKFGGASALFNGTTDYLTTPDSNDWFWGTGDFTVEFWFYLASFTTGQYVTFLSQGTDSNNYMQLQILENGVADNAYLADFTGGVGFLSGGSLGMNLSTGTWYHFAVARSGTTIRYFIDGTLVITTTGVTSPIANQTGNLVVGRNDFNATQYMPGYIDDLRITKGVARYTANFTPPTAAFPNQ